MRLILASQSPRRKEILSLLDIPFEIIVADIEEKIDEDKPLRQEIEKLSFLKANEVFKDNTDAIVIGSDTIVTLGNRVLGKPKDNEEAREMIGLLQDNRHQVITAVTIISAKMSETFSVVSDVFFYPMSEEEIEDYVSGSEPLDKAGAYAIQGKASRFIRKIDGDYYAIMGLPIAELYHRLKKYLKDGS
ncbi:MAG: septum formation protein Maf [Erysipelotrichaceae bacterium]|nr:septum formation protein Maf [Erysipelotrichaceae bacterium]